MKENRQEARTTRYLKDRQLARQTASIPPKSTRFLQKVPQTGRIGESDESLCVPGGFFCTRRSLQAGLERTATGRWLLAGRVLSESHNRA